MNSKVKDSRQAERPQAKQSTAEPQPALNMMIDTWVHMVQGGRHPFGRNANNKG
jgi:hypothetical protein